MAVLRAVGGFKGSWRFRGQFDTVVVAYMRRTVTTTKTSFLLLELLAFLLKGLTEAIT